MNMALHHSPLLGSLATDDQCNHEVLFEARQINSIAQPVRRCARARSKKKQGAHVRALQINTVACVGKTSKDVFAAAAAELGWKEVDVEPSMHSSTSSPRKSLGHTIYCVMQTVDLVERLPLNRTSWATRYLALPDLCDKGNMARMVSACQHFAEKDAFSFLPPTWVLPDQLASLCADMENTKKTYIVKPEDGAQGDGIFLAQGPRDLNVKLSSKRNNSGVAQRYIDKPLLHRGYKFDFRIYVALVGGSAEAPPKVFLCREGLARFCSEPYGAPTVKNMHKCMGHLTNYSLNKRSNTFEHSGDTIEEVYDPDNHASKRPLTLALRQIADEYPAFDVDGFYEGVAEIAGTTVAMMAPVLQVAGRELQGGSVLQCCQILGFDIMLSRSFVPYLLEVNNSPSLCIDEAIPLEQNELSRSTVQPSRGRAAREQLCRCMDMAQPHRHQVSLVDLEIKKAVVRGLFQILSRDSSEGVDDEDFIEVDVCHYEPYSLLAKVEALFSRSGGATKAFSGASMRRTFGPLCGRGSLDKHDLDMLSQRLKVSKFTLRDAALKSHALRIFEYLDVLRQVAMKAFPSLSSLDAVTRALEVVIDT